MRGNTHYKYSAQHVDPSTLGASKVYNIIHKGEHPYTVRVSDIKRKHQTNSGYTKVIDVYAPPNEYRVVMTFFAKKVFVGSGKNGKSRGNTILAYVGNYRYVSIAMPIVMFQTNGEYITNYWSSVGKSGVPTPIAEGTRNVFYNVGWGGFTKIRKHEFRTKTRSAFENYKDRTKLARVASTLLDDSTL